MSGRQRFVKAEKTEEKRKKSAAEFIELMEICLDEGWAPTRCPEVCPVEPDGICPHGFESIALEFGFVENGRIKRKVLQNYGSDNSR